MALAMGADVIKEHKGIFQFEDFPKNFTLDGSLKTKNDPRASGHYARFFSTERRFAKKGSDYILRGSNYLVSIDPTLEVRQKLEILWRDFDDAVDALSLDGGAISSSHYVEQSATLDYMKNAAITLFNALIQEEKIGKFRLNDVEYRALRDSAIHLARHSVQAYYAHLIGRNGDYFSAFSKVVERHEAFREVTDYVEQQYSEGVFSSRFFTRPEAGHPLVIAASVYATAQTVEPLPDTVIGLPSGGTELAFAQQYAYEALRHHETEFVLIPLSLHSIKDAFGTDEFTRDGFLEFLRSKEEKIRDKHLLIVEDNSSTGRTIQLLYDMLTELYNVDRVTVSVAEADLIRTDINSEAKHRTHVASNLVYVHAVNILPISRTLHPKVDLKEVAEERRLAWEYRRRLEGAENDAERMMYRSFVTLCEHPTQEILEKLDNENAIHSGTRSSRISMRFLLPMVAIRIHLLSMRIMHKNSRLKLFVASRVGI